MLTPYTVVMLEPMLNNLLMRPLVFILLWKSQMSIQTTAIFNLEDVFIIWSETNIIENIDQLNNLLN